MTQNNPAISAQGVGKRYGRSWALRGFDLEVAAGTVRGLLGPNGAGKTSADLRHIYDAEVRPGRIARFLT